MDRDNAESPYIPKQIEVVRRRHRERLSSAAGRSGAPSVRRSLPWRGIAAGLVGIAALSVITPYADAYLEASGLAATYLPTGVFLAFLLILAANGVLAVFGLALTRHEILLAYTTMLVPSAITSIGFSLFVVPLLAGAHYYATPLNEWKILHWDHIPDWMAPGPGDVSTWYFEGLPAGESIPWGAWVVPLAAWSLLVIGIYLMLAALSVAMRARWIGAERLQFPLAQIPLEVLGDDERPTLGSAFFRQPLLWGGIAIPFFLHGISGLHEYFPAVPALHITGMKVIDLLQGSRLLDPPFYRLGDVQLNFYSSIIGISYLLRSEVSLSVWLFEVLYRIQEVFFEASGVGHGQFQWTPRHSFGFTLVSRYQKIGAILLATVVYLWAARRELREMVRSAFGRGTYGGQFAIPWWTLWAFLAGATIYFSWTSLAGMSVLAASILLGSFFAVGIVTARIVAATGLLWVWDYYTNMVGLTAVVGTARIDPQTFTLVGLTDFAALNERANIMPMTLDSMKITHSSGIRQGHFFFGAALGIGVALVVSLATVIWLGYTHGGQNLERYPFDSGPNWVLNRVGAFQVVRVGTSWASMGSIAVGAGVMAFLIHMHYNHLWWAVNPLGFVIGDTVAVRDMWLAVFVGWAIKAIVMRVWGGQTYRRLRAVAMGLVIGEFAAVGFWLLVAAITGHTGHRVFPDWAPS